MSDTPVVIDPYTPPAPAPAPATGPITLDDILNSIDYLKSKEASDKTSLEGIGNTSIESLKSQLVLWGTAGFPNAYVILQVPVEVPTVCSDGVTRGLSDYVQYCSGKTIQEHVQLLQDKVTGINVSFANFGSYIGVVVSKP